MEKNTQVTQINIQPTNSAIGNLQPDQEALNQAIMAAKNILDRDYLSSLDQCRVLELPQELKKLEILDHCRIYQLKKLVYDEKEDVQDKLTTIISGIYSIGASLAVIVNGNRKQVDYYLAVLDKSDSGNVSSYGEQLKGLLDGNFPGSESRSLNSTEITQLQDVIFDENNEAYISSISGIASMREEKNQNASDYIQGIEKMVSSLKGKKYTLMVLADPVNPEDISRMRSAYEALYTQLSPFEKTEIDYTQSFGTSNSHSITQGITEGINKSVTDSQTESKSNGWNNSKSSSKSNTTPKGTKIAMRAAGTALPFATLAAGPWGAAACAVAGVGGSILLNTLMGSTSESTSETYASNENHTQGTTYSQQHGESHSKNTGTTDTSGDNQSQGETLHTQSTNLMVKNILQKIEKQIERLDYCNGYGTFQCAAYILSPDSESNRIAASSYQALMRGENSHLQNSGINHWHYTKQTDVENLLDYLEKFTHPCFQGHLPEQVLSPASMLSAKEVAIQLGLPRKSFAGLPVIETAAFGQNIFRTEGIQAGPQIKLGKLYHMGQEQEMEVPLDLRSLTSHAFVTGSTGSGKSNTIYEILRQLNTHNIKFMVVEPAKGEYKNVFGYRPDVTVLGTNPNYTQLLRINPFKFPPKVHILEHIDRLVEIFNVCWPMYAAMPAVLKDALLQAYQVCGWDLGESKNCYSPDLFPTFLDLQNEIVEVIHSSAYSEEVKGNYIGSLATRVKSLTNGLNGQIFSANELDNEVLFDSNVIIDLSRVGSLETKSLIMGVLVMRLNEHRMSYSEGMNIPLRHVTVLEEAHNILKRTSTEQNAESPNLTGKSVEMLSNSIAEMRTYGEGFIIADQSPSAVDLSAIRNTNTKIIMRLPDEVDRRSAGKSAAVRDEQLDEIAKLSKGVAVVYQNDWLEPVLCHISKFSGLETPYEYKNESNDNNQNLKCNDEWVITELLSLLMGKRLPSPPEIQIDRLIKELPFASISTRNKVRFNQFIKEYKSTGTLRIWSDDRFADLAKMTVELLGCDAKVEMLIKTSLNFDDLNFGFARLIQEKTVDASNELMLALSQCFMKSFSVSNPEQTSIYAAWKEEISSGKAGVL